MKSFLLTLVQLLLSAGFLLAQQNMPAHFHYQKLDNGLEVLIIEDASVPLVTIELAVRNGAFTETAETNGLAHLYEHLFFTANQVISTEQEFVEKLETLGVVYNGTTSDERVNYFININSYLFDEGLTLMSNAIQKPVFSKDAIASEQEIIEAKFQQAESNPVHFLVRDVNNKLWGSQAPRKNALGSRNVMLNASPEDLEKMHSRYYVPNNSILLVSGDIKRDKALASIQKTFGNWPKTIDPLQAYPVTEFDSLHTSQSVITLNENAQGPLVMAAFHGPNTRHNRNDTYAADVLAYMLSQKGSKLNKDVTESGLAYQVGVGYTTQKYGAPLTIFLVPKAQGVKEAMAALETNISQWADTDFFSDEELENARRMLSIQELYSREVSSEIVHNISYWWASADIDYYLDYVDNIQNVSREDVSRVVRTYIQGQPNVTGLLVTLQMKELLGLSNFQPLKTE